MATPPGSDPSPSAQESAHPFRKPFVLLFLAAFVGAAAFLPRYVEIEKWRGLHLPGAAMLSTHDAYHWLSGAKGLGEAAGSPPALLIQWGAPLFGGSFEDVAFWAPAAAAMLAPMAALLWGMLIGRPQCGLIAGIFTAFAPAYFFRTRLGYYDTDMGALFLPLAISLPLGAWLLRKLNPLWLIPAGLLTFYSAFWHGHIALFSQSVFWIAFLLLLVRRRSEGGARFSELGAFGAAAFFGIPGAIAGLVIFLCRRKCFVNSLWTPALLALTVGVCAALTPETSDRAVWLWETYSKPQAQFSSQAAPPAQNPSHGAPPVYPAVGQSVIESQDIPISRFLLRLHPWKTLSALALLGVCLLFIQAPATVLLAPLLLLSLSALFLGLRMSMFGAPVAGLGLGILVDNVVSYCWKALGRRRGESALRWAGAVAITLVLAIPGIRIFNLLPPSPVLTQEQTKALLWAKEHTPKTSMLWTWWDWGYAARCLSERTVFADGGRNDGEYIFTLGAVLSTSSPVQANQVVAYSAQHDFAPWKIWNPLSAAQVSALLKNLTGGRRITSPPTAQYLLIQAQDINLLPWIMYYGLWDIEAGESEKPRVMRLGRSFSINYDEGFVLPRPGASLIPLKTVDILKHGAEKPAHFAFAHPVKQNANRMHLLAFRDSGNFYLLDQQAYSSTLVQLFLHGGEAAGANTLFELVYDDFPHARIFKVL